MENDESVESAATAESGKPMLLVERDLPVFIGWNLETVMGKAQLFDVDEDGRPSIVIKFRRDAAEEVIDWFKNQVDPMAVNFGGYPRIRDHVKEDIKVIATKDRRPEHPMKMKNKEN